MRGVGRGRRRSAGTILLALLLGACGTTEALVTPSLQPVVSATATAGDAPSPSPAPSRTASSTPGPSVASPGSSLTLHGIQALLVAQLTSAVRRLHLPGVQASVLLADGESWSGAAGIADQATGRPMGTADVFDVGSITKTFVAAAVMRLVEGGMLRLDDPLSRWLPAYPGAASITLRELLAHTSGLADYFANEHLLTSLGARKGAVWQPDALLPFVGKPIFPPGRGWYYSNTDYLLLGDVIEAVTGQRLEAVLRDEFLAPLGLRATALQGGTASAPAPALGPLAQPYQRLPGPKVVFRAIGDGSGYLPFRSLATALGAAGSMVSTSTDVARWGAGLYGGQVVSPASLAAMEDTSISTPYDPRFIYGLGTQRLSIDTFTSFGHGGACSGYRAALRYFPILGASIAVLTNIDGPDPDRVVADLVTILTAPRPGGRIRL